MRNKKLIQFLVLITLIFLGVKIFNVRSNKKSENNIQTNSLTITSNIEINSLDPIKSNNKNQEYNITNIFDSLYEPNPYKPGQYIPVIADGLPEVSEDRLTINIKIKPDIFFHNNKCFKDGEGRPINSNDIKISLLRALNTLESDSSVNLKDRILGINEWIKSNTELIDYNSDIEGIVIIDENNIQLKLKKPIPELIEVLSTVYYSIVPKEAIDFYGNEFGKNPVGSGPYYVSEFNPDSGIIIYKKNTKYNSISPIDLYGKDKNTTKPRLPYADSIVTIVMEDSNDSWQKFNDKELDILELNNEKSSAKGFENEEEMRESINNKSIKMSLNNGPDIYIIGMNLDLDIFKKIEFRKALSFGYDIDRLNEEFFFVKPESVHSVLPKDIEGYNINYKNPNSTYDVDVAAQLLETAGYSESNAIPDITLDIINKPENLIKAEFFKECMKKLNINIHIRQNTQKELLSRVKNKDYMLYEHKIEMKYINPKAVLDYIKNNCSEEFISNLKYKSDKFVDLLDKASSMGPSSQRNKIFEEMDMMIGDQIPVIPINYPYRVFLQQEWVNIPKTKHHFPKTKYIEIDIIKKKEKFAQKK